MAVPDPSLMLDPKLVEVYTKAMQLSNQHHQIVGDIHEPALYITIDQLEYIIFSIK